MLEVKNVYKSYDKTEVLHGISLELRPGEIHGLIGANSAGKTTLIKCITGIYNANSGSIQVDGQNVYDNPQAKSIIGYVADYNEYIQTYNAQQMVKMFQRFYPEFDTEKFNTLNEIFELPLEKMISTLSKGQKMRLAIMLEICHKPKYLIMDEPTSGLDPVAKEALYQLLIKEAEENEMGILISSHNLAGLEKLCDSVTMIHSGTVEKQLSVDSMKHMLSKVNVIFENGADPALYHHDSILQISNVGSIYTLLIENFDASAETLLKEWGASFVETAPLNLEEVYVALAENRKE